MTDIILIIGLLFSIAFVGIPIFLSLILLIWGGLVLLFTKKKKTIFLEEEKDK